MQTPQKANKCEYDWTGSLKCTLGWTSFMIEDQQLIILSTLSMEIVGLSPLESERHGISHQGYCGQTALEDPLLSLLECLCGILRFLCDFDLVCQHHQRQDGQCFQFGESTRQIVVNRGVVGA